MMKQAVITSVCGLALAGQPPRRGPAHFMALSQLEDTCDPSAYTGPTAEEYAKMCSGIDAECEAACNALRNKHNANVAELKAECVRQQRILAGKEEDHADEKSHRKAEDMDVADANKAVQEKAHCRPELFAAKEDLASQQAVPNDTPGDIDAECKAKKRVMKAEQCVEELRAAEAVLSKERSQHKQESSEEDQAASALPPQEERVRIACANTGGPAPPCNCGGQGKKDDLLRQADEAIESLLAEYLRQKKILEGKEDVHADEKADVDKQEKVVAGERKDVKEARIVVARDAHCPPELETAQAALSKQQAIPNESPGDIDAECEAKKAVMAAEACVDRLRKAEAVLRSQQDEHGDEKSELNGEAREEAGAAAALPPQQKIVCDLKAALDAARNARKALPCGSDQKSEPEPEPEKKSGASTAALAGMAALFCALVQA